MQGEDVFVSFEIPVFLFWLSVSISCPGAVIAFSLFRKDDMLAIEKLLLGFAIGFAALPLIPFVLYMAAGMHFSYQIAILSVIPVCLGHSRGVSHKII